MESLFSTAALPWTLAAAGALLAAGTAIVGLWHARGTTAVSAAVWAVLAAAALAGECFLRADGRLSDPAEAATARLVVAALCVCPSMAILGAKHPQHGVWQVIVASLAVVLMMPAASAVFVRPGSLPSVHAVARGFMLVLAVVGWLNYLGTRRWIAATLVTVGGLILIRGVLPGLADEAAMERPWLDCLGCWLVAVGGLWTSGSGSCRSRDPRAEPRGAATTVRAIEGPFVAFRDTIGAAWSLRIAERFDELADRRGWPCRLSLAGLDAGGDSRDTAWQDDAIRSFEGIMLRFVTRDWLSRHRGINSPSPPSP